MNYVLQPLVNQVDQLTHQVDDVTTDQLMTTPYKLGEVGWDDF